LREIDSGLFSRGKKDGDYVEAGFFFVVIFLDGMFRDRWFSRVACVGISPPRIQVGQNRPGIGSNLRLCSLRDVHLFCQSHLSGVGSSPSPCSPGPKR